MSATTEIVVRREADLLDPAEARVLTERLHKARDVDGLRDVLARAAANDRWLALQRGKLDDLDRKQLLVTEVTLRAERAIGQLLAETVTTRPGHVDGDDMSTRLPDGVSRDQSSKWQRLAAIPDREFEDALATDRKSKKLTRAAMLRRAPKPAKAEVATFNRTDENVGWARWTWNPVTGCLHNCPYCYAREIAEERWPQAYPHGFEPEFWPDRITAPQHTKLPAAATDDPEWRRVFTCSMADLFGKWVPQDWIDKVFRAIVDAPQWEFLCLTKFPQRLAELDWPDNVWAGTTVDRQHRVDLAQRHFADVTAGVKWLSCEPLLEPLRFDSLAMFDWVVVGSCTTTSGAPAFAPPFDWVVDLYEQARAAGCKVYLKHNLFGSRDGVEPGMAPVREWPR